MVYGYARCSTSEDKQDINRQIRELKEAGVEAKNVFFEYEHGTAAVKPELEHLMEIAQPDDEIKVTEVSRLSRSTQQLCEIIKAVREKHLRLEIIGSITVDCRGGELDPMTNAFLQMSGVFAELERNMISTRVKSGMKNAAAKGSKIGRPKTSRNKVPENFLRLYPLYKEKKMNKKQLAGASGLSRPTVDKYIKILESSEE